MKKLIIAITTLLMLASAPAMAQIFLDDDDINVRGDRDDPALGVIIAEQGVTYDQYQPYVPVGEGIVLLAGLAGAYLVSKRKKEE